MLTSASPSNVRTPGAGTSLLRPALADEPAAPPDEEDPDPPDEVDVIGPEADDCVMAALLFAPSKMKRSPALLSAKAGDAAKRAAEIGTAKPRANTDLFI